MNWFRSVPQTQRISLVANTAFDQTSAHTDAYYELTPSIQISGAHKNDIRIDLPGPVTGAGVGNFYKSVVVLSGVVAIGGAIYQS